MKLGWTAALLVLLAGCATASRVVRLDTGQADTLVFTPRSGAEPVDLNGDEFKKAVAKRAWEVRPSTRPEEAARKLFEVEARSGSYTYETRSRRVTPLGPDEHLEGAPPAEVELTRDYLRWCERTGRPGDCLRLLTESPIINGDGRFALALALAKGAVLDEMLEAFKDMADPHAMVAAVLWTWTTYMVLISIPDVTVSKGLAAVGEVETVAVSAEAVTLTLAPNAVAMSAGDGRGNGHVTGELTGGASDIHVDKVVNSNMPHSAERAVERAGFSSVQDARAALQEFGRQIEKSGLPPGTIRDMAHADRVIVPGFGRGGAVVYQLRDGVLKLKTVLQWRP